MSFYSKHTENEQTTTTLNNDKNTKNFSTLSRLPNFVLKWIENQHNNIIGIWDEKGKLVYVSSAVEKFIGYHPNQLLGEGWHQIISSENFEMLTEKLTKKLTVSHRFKMECFHREGNSVYFDCLLGKELDKRKKKIYLIGLFNHIRDPDEAKEVLIQSEKMSVAGQLAAGIAHEIRNPLTSLKGFLQLLQAGIKQKEAYYQIMSDELDKIETITSELLFISKPLTNKREIESVDSMINDVMVLLNSQAHIHNVNIIRETANDFYVNCDRSQIKQVLINIIKNAIEATGESGTITIGVEAIQTDIKIDIIDEGPGIPEEILDKIGEPFFTTKEGGTGLGLMITKQILEQHHGDL